jgi:hypothetical protein
MKPEYHEGPEALEQFEKTMAVLFRAPKTVTTKKETKQAPARPRFQPGFAHAAIAVGCIIEKWSRLRLSRAQSAEFPESAPPKSNG